MRAQSRGIRTSGLSCILYVNPSDLDSTDAIENQGNSLTTPFKTIQRALIEAARFSYIEGNNNECERSSQVTLLTPTGTASRPNPSTHGEGNIHLGWKGDRRRMQKGAAP